MICDFKIVFGVFRDTWFGWVLFTEMDRVRFWFASDCKPFRGFGSCYYHSITARESQSRTKPFCFISCCVFSINIFLVCIENRSSGPFIGSILNCNSLSWKISQGKFLYKYDFLFFLKFWWKFVVTCSGNIEYWFVLPII